MSSTAIQQCSTADITKSYYLLACLVAKVPSCRTVEHAKDQNNLKYTYGYVDIFWGLGSASVKVLHAGGGLVVLAKSGSCGHHLYSLD